MTSASTAAHKMLRLPPIVAASCCVSTRAKLSHFLCLCILYAAIEGDQNMHRKHTDTNMYMYMHADMSVYICMSGYNCVPTQMNEAVCNQLGCSEIAFSYLLLKKNFLLTLKIDAVSLNIYTYL